MIYLYKNNGDKGQLLCKVCGDRFFADADPVEKHMVFRCPFCGNALVPVKSRKFFIVHKCVNKKCSYYLDRLKKIHPDDPDKPKYLYKLHYIYREFTVDFFKVDLRSLPDNASSLKFRTFNSHIMGLCLTMHVNLGLSLRKTSQALKDLYGISISHQQVANYARTAALMIKPFVDNYEYDRCGTYVGDETYIRVKGEKSFLAKLFSFSGRMGRLAYFVLVVISDFYLFSFTSLPDDTDELYYCLWLLALPLFAWVRIAGNARRCHDFGRSGWMQIIPFYILWMLFTPGDNFYNKYDS